MESSHSRHAATVRPFCLDDQQEVILLWERCGLTRPWNAPTQDIQRKLSVQPEGFLVAIIDGVVVATVMAGFEGHRGWINYLAVDPDHRRRGLGRELMERAEQFLRDLGCPKINLQVRSTNAEANAFYEAIGFSCDDVVSFGKRLVDDAAH